MAVGGTVFSKLHIEPPGIYKFLNTHKLVFCVALYMGGNFARNWITRTHAFEIYINDVLVSSVINNATIIKIPELIQVAKRIIHN